MKILFISANNEQEPYPVAPLGTAYVASFLRGKGNQVGILDLCFVENDLAAVDSAIETQRPELIGISLRNVDNLTYNRSVSYLPRVKSIVEHIKEKSCIPIVVGGSGFSIFPEEILRYLAVDTGIIGEGERSLAQYVDLLSNGGVTPEAIPNLCCLKEGRFMANRVITGNFVCSPDRTLLNNKKYLDLGGMGNIQSKRGCPFRCTYCTYPSIEGNELRLRDPEAVALELKEMQDRFGIDYVFFVDDIFNFPEEHARGICESILRMGVTVYWTCFATPLNMTADFAGLMKRAGCRGVEFGSDAVTEKTLKGLGKHFSPDDIAHATEACKEAGLPCAHYLIVGGPGEDLDTLDEAFHFFDSVSPAAVIALTGLRIYPNTALHDIAIDTQVVGRDRGLLEPVFYTSPAMDPEEMLRRISSGVARRNNWIVPGLHIRYGPEMFKVARKLQQRGPLWNML